MLLISFVSTCISASIVFVSHWVVLTLADGGSSMGSSIAFAGFDLLYLWVQVGYLLPHAFYWQVTTTRQSAMMLVGFKHRRDFSAEALLFIIWEFRQLSANRSVMWTVNIAKKPYSTGFSWVLVWLSSSTSGPWARRFCDFSGSVVWDIELPFWLLGHQKR